MEKPILFNTEMVQAILQGRKTTTRRVMKPQPECVYVHGERKNLVALDETAFRIMEKGGNDRWINPPYQIGDILWVRETWREQPIGKDKFEIQYKADFDEAELACYGKRGGYAPAKWHPSIHMSRIAARIFLKVKNIRAERLKDITEDEAKAEGIPNDYPMNPVYCPKCKGEGLVGSLHPISLGYMEIDCPDCGDVRVRFKNLWDSIYAKQSYGWNTNPWVWVIEFQKEMNV
jgi:hypothetical protein